MCASSRTQTKLTLDLSVDRCPADASEAADLYVLNRLTPAESQVFEEHFLQCPDCAEKAELAFEFLAAIKRYHA